MAAIKPVIFTPIEDSEVAFEVSSNEEVIKKIYQNLNMLAELALIGSVEAIAINIPGVPAPQASIFQACDGSEITEPTSPLRTTGITNRFTPDIRNRYIRGANNSTVIGNELGGSASINLTHNHGGNTVLGSPTFPIRGEEGDERFTTDVTHFHFINNDLGVTPLELAHQKVAFYLKIN